MSWLSAVPTLASTALLLLGPGLLLAWILRLRGLWLWAFAGPASVSVIVVGSVLGSVLGIPWSLFVVAVTGGALAVVALVLRLTVVRAPLAEADEAARGRGWLTPVGLVLGGLAIAALLVIIVGAPGNISQTFDNVFHLNAVRFVLDTGDASPFTVGRMTGDAVWFYPAAWHGVVALVSQLSGASIAVSSNAVLFVVASVVWPAAIVLLTRVLAKGSRCVDFAAALLASALPAFPFLLADYGVLYPYLLGAALLPSMVAATLVVLRLRDASAGIASVVIMLLGSMPGLAISHPGAFVAWMVAALVCGGCAYVFLIRSSPTRRVRVIASSGLGVGVLVAIAAGYVLRPAKEARGWSPVGSMGQAAGEGLFLSPHYPAVPMLVCVLLWIGLAVLLRRRARTDIAAIALFGTFVLLYVVAKALPWHTVRDLITGSWYNDATRLAALLPMVAVPIASTGAVAACVFLAGAWRRGRWPLRGALVSALAIALVFQAHSVYILIRWAQPTYEYEADSPLISTDELALLKRLPSEVGADDVIAGNPWTGTSLAYAFSDRRVLMPHILTDETPDEVTINDSLRDAAPDSAVCDALERQGVSYVLDFGDTEVHGDRHDYAGLDRLSDSKAVELVDQQGDARLYKIIGCEE